MRKKSILQIWHVISEISPMLLWHWQIWSSWKYFSGETAGAHWMFAKLCGCHVSSWECTKRPIQVCHVYLSLPSHANVV